MESRRSYDRWFGRCCDNNPIKWFDPDGLFKFNAEFLVGLAGSFKTRVGPAKLEASIDLGTQHTPLLGPEYVTQGGYVKADLILVDLGLGVEREAIGKTRPPKFDYVGRVIPYSGRSVNTILKGKPFEIVPLIGKGSFENATFALGAQFLIGGTIEFDFTEEIFFLKNFFSNLFKEECE